ncbi:MAG: hypothetical protein ABEJ65_05130 [bacterium]
MAFSILLASFQYTIILLLPDYSDYRFLFNFILLEAPFVIFSGFIVVGILSILNGMVSDKSSQSFGQTFFFSAEINPTWFQVIKKCIKSGICGSMFLLGLLSGWICLAIVSTYYETPGSGASLFTGLRGTSLLLFAIGIPVVVSGGILFAVVVTIVNASRRIE